MQRPAFPPAVREIFERWNHVDFCDSLEASHRQLIERRENAVEVANPAEPRRHTGSNCLVIQQALLHRAERLLAASGVMLLENNVYGLALVVRGHYEATAVLGYVCDRLKSLKAENIDFERFAYDMARAVLGAKHPQFAKAPDPPHILTCIEKADRYLDTHVLKQKTGMLADGYNWLSEFAHPNFCANVSAYRIDKVNRRFVFRHDEGIQESDFELISSLVISAGLFIFLFDHCTRRITENGLTE